MDPIQHEKSCIEKREQTGRAGCSLLLLSVFGVCVFLSTNRVAHTMASLNGCWLVLSFGLLYLLILGRGISRFGPYLQRTQQRKQQWLNEYGQHIHAVVSKHPEKNVLIIGGSRRSRNTSDTRYLHWQDPHTGQRYSFCVNTRFSPTLRNLSEGTLCQVLFDPDDLSFFVVPDRIRKPNHERHSENT